MRPNVHAFALFFLPPNLLNTLPPPGIKDNSFPKACMAHFRFKAGPVHWSDPQNSPENICACRTAGNLLCSLGSQQQQRPGPSLPSEGKTPVPPAIPTNVSGKEKNNWQRLWNFSFLSKIQIILTILLLPLRAVSRGVGGGQSAALN